MEDSSEDYSLLFPFWIDTDGYTDRDRLMFTCGVEFCIVREMLDEGSKASMLIHAENESRVRMLCGRQNRQCKLTRLQSGWVQLDLT